MAKIINFHDIYDRKWFSDTIEVIQSMYEIVPFSEIQKFYKGQKIAKNAVHLTVDDGHISTYTIIYPILKELGLAASIFVSPKIIEEKTNFWYFESGDYQKDQLKICIAEVLQIPIEKLENFHARSIMKQLRLEDNWKIIHLYQEKYDEPIKEGQYISREQLLELENSGVFEIGAHTMNHPILANENDEISTFEIKESINQLGRILNRKITTFAYPNGTPNLDFGQREINSLKAAEIDYAFSFEFKNLNKKDNLRSIPRYGLYHGNKDFVRKKLKYGTIWEPFKKAFFDNEEKHRIQIRKTLNLQH